MNFLFTDKNPQKVAEVTFAGRSYGITFIPSTVGGPDDAGEIGVFTLGQRRVKYMRIKWDYKAFLPQLRKAYIRSRLTAEELFEDLVFCSKSQTACTASCLFCEHVLINGRSRR